MARGEGWVGVVFRQLHGSGYIILLMRGLFFLFLHASKPYGGGGGGLFWLEFTEYAAPLRTSGLGLGGLQSVFDRPLDHTRKNMPCKILLYTAGLY